MEYDRAVVNLAQAEANLARHLLQIEQAQAGLEEARALLGFTRITAPSDGMIVSIFAQEGQTVKATVSEADMRRLEGGMQAYFTTPVDSERRWQGQLKEISPIPQAAAGMGGLAQFDAFKEVENPDGALLPGMTAQGFFVVEAAHGVLKVPRGALTFADEPIGVAGQYVRQNEENGQARSRGATVQVVGAEGELQERTVRVVAGNDVEVEVLSGLSEGERVVTGVAQPPIPELSLFSGG